MKYKIEELKNHDFIVIKVSPAPMPWNDWIKITTDLAKKYPNNPIVATDTQKKAIWFVITKSKK